MSNCTVVVPNTKANKKRYNDLVKGWWNWIYTPNCDNNNTNGKLNVTFFRDDIIGTQLVIKAGISSTPTQLHPCHTKNVTVNAGSSIFLPVYHVNTVIDHPYGDGSKCGNIQRCIDSSRDDLKNLYHQWATIRKIGGNEQNIANLKDHYFESDAFTLTVNGKHNLNREQGFSLRRGTHRGVAFGTYILLNDFQPGNYELDFGGKARNYRTRAVYNLTVK
jgi:hypothetical protein